MNEHQEEFLELVHNTDDRYTLNDLGGMVGLTFRNISRNESRARIANRLNRHPDLDPYDPANWVDPITPTKGADRLMVDRANGVGEWDGEDDTFETED